MIARTVKIQLTVFAALAAIALLITGVNYVGLNKDLWSKPFTVKAHFPSSGGIFTNAEVTYRGVTIGRVGTLHLTKDGVIVDLKIDKGEKVPARTHAQVEELSAVGEQYVDLRPYTDSGPYLKNGSAISLANTSVPIDENTVLVDLDNLVKSVPQSALQTTINELGKAFNNAGPSLQQLIHARQRGDQGVPGQPGADHLADRGRQDRPGNPDRRVRCLPVVREQHRQRLRHAAFQ